MPEWKPTGSDRRCRKCSEKGHILYRVVESSDGGHEDYQYWCQICNGKWWIDGIDS